jgi:hypothetical protein
MKRIAALLLLLTLTACGEGEFRIAPPIPAGGGSAPARPADSRPLAPGPHKMLQDPEENLSEDTIQVTANSDDEAHRTCEQIAANRSDPSTIVECVGCQKRTKTTGKYVCTLRIETRR